MKEKAISFLRLFPNFLYKKIMSVVSIYSSIILYNHPMWVIGILKGPWRFSISKMNCPTISFLTFSAIRGIADLPYLMLFSLDFEHYMIQIYFSKFWSPLYLHSLLPFVNCRYSLRKTLSLIVFLYPYFFSLFILSRMTNVKQMNKEC